MLTAKPNNLSKTSGNYIRESTPQTPVPPWRNQRGLTPLASVGTCTHVHIRPPTHINKQRKRARASKMAQ